MKIQMAIEEVLNSGIMGLNYKFLTKWDMDMEKNWNVRKRMDHRLKELKVDRKAIRW